MLVVGLVCVSCRVSCRPLLVVMIVLGLELVDFNYLLGLYMIIR